MMLQMSARTKGGLDLTETFFDLYERESRVVLRYLRTAVRDPATADDLCADAFCRAWDAWPRFKGGDAEARAWVVRIARNLVIDRVRRDGRLKFSELSDTEVAGDSASAGTDILDLRRALSSLGRDDRDLLALRLAGMSHAEIALIQGRSEEAVKKAWQRALVRVRELLEGQS